MDEKCDFLNSDKKYKLFNNEKMATLKIGESIECLPFGEITLKEIREDKPKRADMYVKRIEGIDFETKKLNELLRVPFDFCNPTIKVGIEKVPCIDEKGRENHVWKSGEGKN